MEGVTARKRPFGSIAAVVALGLVLLVPVGASAHQVTRPTISGIPQESQTLTASATWTAEPPVTVTWKWQRCKAGDLTTCKAITGATARTYVVAAADVGFVLRVRVIVTDASSTVSRTSLPTGVVAPLSAPPPPPVEPPPAEPEEPAPPPSQPFNPPANPVIAPAPTGASELRLMSPFPVVRISGRLTPSGADVTRLTVRTPRGASVTVRCRGRSCPVRRFARAAALKRLRSFERHLRAGTRLDIVVRKPGRIGKWTTITIRRGAPPRRLDRCSYPGRGRPAACPAA